MLLRVTKYVQVIVFSTDSNSFQSVYDMVTSEFVVRFNDYSTKFWKSLAFIMIYSYFPGILRYKNTFWLVKESIQV
jgi:hypothetical protein